MVRMTKECEKCGEGFNALFGYESYCPTCIKDEWVDNRSKRESDYLAYDMVVPKEDPICAVENYDTRTEGEVMFMETIDELYNLYSRKNRDYGNAFGQTFEEYGFVVSSIRLQDKLNRFKKLMKGTQEVKDESIRDTLVDLANYAIMTIIEMDKRG